MSQHRPLSQRRVPKTPFALTLTALLTIAPFGAGCGDDDDDAAGLAGRGGSAQGGREQSGGNAGKSTAGAGGYVSESGAAAGGAAQGGEAGSADVEIIGDRRIPFTPETDREFVHFFIEHHQMAVHMAEMVVENGATAEIQELAERMVTDQTAEIETLQQLEEELQDQREPRAWPADPHHEADMQHMMTLTGTELERMFLVDMIPHHAAGLPAAHRARPHLTRPALRTVAEDIAHHQAAEIGEMKALLDDLNVTTAGQDLAEADPNRPDFGLVGDRRLSLTPDDLTFIDFFVPHHEMAVMMAEHVLAHGDNAELHTLAQEMRSAQLQEIETMRAVREELTGDPDPIPTPADPHMQAEMAQMMEASGLELDVMFLEEMIPHHAAGLPTAHRAKPHVQNDQLAAMSDDIYHAQAREIGDMERLLGELER